MMCRARTSPWHMTFAVFSVFVMLFVVGVVYFFLFFDTPFLSYRNLPFPTMVKTVVPGDVVPLKVIRCNDSDHTKTYLTTHSLENIEKRVYWILPSQQVAIDPGCTTETSAISTLPLELPPGTYRLFGTAEVHGVIRTHYVDWYSQPFTVLPKFVPIPPTVPIPLLQDMP